MKKSVFVIICFCLFIGNVYAKRGCCSHHGGVAGCSSSGRTICNDGTLSPTCTCLAPTPKIIYGCTDKKAKNYNPNANRNNNSCKYYVYGCMDKEAKNYNPKAEKSDNSCEYYLYGCTDETALNYNKDAEKDDGTCKYEELNNLYNNNSSNNETDKTKETTYNEANPIISLIYYSISILILYMRKYTLIAKAIFKFNGKNKIFLAIVYVLTVIGPLIDFIAIIYNKIKNHHNEIEDF